MPTVKVKNTGKATGTKGKTATKATTTKAATKAAGTKAKTTKAAATAATNGNGTARRTEADIDKLVPQFVKHLKAGGTMRELKQEHGFSDDGPIRKALARAGKDSKGNALELPTIADTPKSVATARKAGHAWYIIALALDKTESEVKAMAEKAGLDVSGRVRVGGGRGR